MRKKHSEWFAFDASFPSSTSVLGKSSVFFFFFPKIILAKIILVSFNFTARTSLDPGTVSRMALGRRMDCLAL